MPEPTIRRATSADAETLAAIGAETFTETFGHLSPPRDWLVEVDGETVGYGTAGPCGLPHAEVTPACGEIKRIYFRRAWQGAGAGGRLFAQMVDWLQAEGPRAIWIGVWSENHGAQRFYARHGYTKVGEYGFEVGDTVDREYILRRSAEA